MPHRRHILPYLYLLAGSVLFYGCYFPGFTAEQNYAYLLNADFLHVAFFSETLFTDPSGLGHWYTTPTPYLFPDMLLFGILNRLTGNPHITFPLVWFVAYLCLHLALYRLLGLFFTGNAAFRLSVLTVYNLVCLALFYGSKGDSFLYLNQFVPVNHLWAFIGFACFLKQEIPAGKFSRWSWYAAVVLMAASDPVFLFYFLPAQWLLWKKHGHAGARWGIVLVCAVGFGLFKALYAFGWLHSANAHTLAFHTENLWNLPRILISLAHSPAFVVFGLLWLTSSAAFRLPVPHKNVLLYTVWGVPVLISGLGYFAGPDTLRYISGSLFLGVLVGIAVLLYPLRVRLENMVINARTAGIPAGVAGICIALQVYHKQFTLPVPDHIRCIETYARQHQSRYMLANYWTAKPLLFFTEGITVLPITPELQPELHEADGRMFIALPDSVRMVVFTGGLHTDRFAPYRDFSFPAAPCLQDSVIVLKKNPFP